MSDKNKTGIKPPTVPTVNRETGAVSPTAEYANLDAPSLDGWVMSTDPFETGTMHAAHNFADECPVDQRKKAIDEFFPDGKVI